MALRVTGKLAIFLARRTCSRFASPAAVVCWFPATLRPVLSRQGARKSSQLIAKSRLLYLWCLRFLLAMGRDASLSRCRRTIGTWAKRMRGRCIRNLVSAMKVATAEDFSTEVATSLVTLAVVSLLVVVIFRVVMSFLVLR